jgi:hypothetical protein
MATPFPMAAPAPATMSARTEPIDDHQAPSLAGLLLPLLAAWTHGGGGGGGGGTRAHAHLLMDDPNLAL